MRALSAPRQSLGCADLLGDLTKPQVLLARPSPALEKMPKMSKAPFLPGPLPGGEVAVRSYRRRRSKAKKKTEQSKKLSPKTESRPKIKQPTMRRICRKEATRSSLKAVAPRSPTQNTPESTGKANFPHDLENGALQQRGAHISKRRRKKLDGELGQADAMPDAVLIG